MTSRKITMLALFTIAFATPVLAQGAGGGSGGGAGGAAAGAGAATSGTAATGTSANTGGTNQTANPAANQTNKNKIQDEQSAAVNGTKTAPMPAGSGAVSAPGVGVGHAANGVPIGNPGSGLGSPENPGPTRKRTTK